MKSKILLSLVCFLSMSASQVDVQPKPQFIAEVIQLTPAAIVCIRALSDIVIFHGEETFFALRDGKATKIHSCNTDEELRCLSSEQLKSFLSDGYVTLTQSSNGDYNLKANLRLHGGGLLGGKIAYWITKTICWAIVGGAAAAGTGYVAGAAVPAVATKLGLSVATTAKLAAVAKGGASLATAKAGVVGGGAKLAAVAIASDATLTAASTEVVVAYTGAAGGITGLAASIEGLSLAVGGFFGFATGPI